MLDALTFDAGSTLTPDYTCARIPIRREYWPMPV